MKQQSSVVIIKLKEMPIFTDKNIAVPVVVDYTNAYVTDGSNGCVYGQFEGRIGWIATITITIGSTYPLWLCVSAF